ncbi:MAG: putative transporter [Bacteroidaceae bacterium]
MEWFNSVFIDASALQAVVVISIICAIGLMLGKAHVRGISLGVTFVFFVGILAGHIGLHIDASMLNYAESFGLVLFVYALGLQVGPGFVSSFRQGGTLLNFLALLVVAIGTLMAIVCTWITDISLPDMMGVLCGATTNTPALGAVQQTLKGLGQPSAAPALSCAVTYPLGVVGVIIGILCVRFMLSHHLSKRGKTVEDKADQPFIASFYVCNPAIFDKSLYEVANLNDTKFVVSRLWRDDTVLLPESNTVLQEGDRILVIASKKYIPQLTVFFGRLDATDWNKKNIDWNAVDNSLVSQRILITRHEINGKKLGSLHLRNRFGINVSRVYRAGIQLVATPNLVLRMGDRLTVVGEALAIKKVGNELGNAVKHLEEPNLISIFVGIVLGLALGAIPFSIPGISIPVKFGIAGGPIVVGLLIGAYGPRIHMLTYTTNSANRMLRALGLSIYLACLGLDSGTQFFATVVRPEGLLWIVLGLAITVVPVVLMAYLSVRVAKLDLSSTAGMICGSMANPFALDYVTEILPGNKASVAYAAVYPLCMFVRVISVQLILIALL